MTAEYSPTRRNLIWYHKNSEEGYFGTLDNQSQMRWQYIHYLLYNSADRAEHIARYRRIMRKIAGSENDPVQTSK